MGELREAGVKDDDVTVIFGEGKDGPVDPREARDFLGEEISGRILTVSHDCKTNDLVEVGSTSFRTHISLNRVFTEAEVKILIGEVRFDSLAGYTGGWKSILSAVGAVSAILAGAVLFPILLPWIPTPNFSTKGFLLGGLVALPFVLVSFLINPDVVLWRRAGLALAYLLALPPVTAYLSLNFTGATTFTSKSGVKREIFAYIPVMAILFGIGIVLSITLTLTHVFGGAS